MTITREAAIAARIEDWSGLLTPVQMAMAATSFGAGWDARPGIVDDHEVCTTDLARAIAERDASRAVNADLLAAQHRLTADLGAALAVIKTVADSAREGLDDCDDDCDMSAFWVLETLMPPPDLAAEHRADLARQSEHYTAQPMYSDDGSNQ
ncbi:MULTISPECIES: hypothetical protein [Cryobacterium]|uniref:Uncharacterized protein n=1 Tax=Cryobacterium breve TaxID=1259258 RepID=A0ABY2J4D7_9MICO|nr:MULTISPECIES: hypothetical protein [Cryobacterium]TFC92057.1 hypothetical protein E3T20_12140 [Cryobacterium sp. TmT3-12]TFC99804.1 hypothetical protein E3O65_05365 [Cryobacterium breve]